MKIHLVGLPHTQTVEEEMTTCAFTGKIVRFGEMMTELGYEIILYSGEHNKTICSEHVPVFTDEQQRHWYGDHDPNTMPSATWDPDDPAWVMLNTNAAIEIKKRIEKEDILLLFGTSQQPIANDFPHHISAEWAVGYTGVFAPYRCYESHAWKHYMWARLGEEQGRWYDAVIPNFFRPEDFSVADERDDYLLFVGRVTADKGPHVAAEIARACGRKLLIAGSGVVSSDPGKIVSDSVTIEGDHVEYVGTVGVKERNELMSKAHAVLVPTLYIEPFGAVAVEAQLCGTPAITTDWGAFTETVEEGVSGFRFHTLQEAVEAVEETDSLDAQEIRERAISLYSLDAVGPQYVRWLEQIQGIWDKGWYTMKTSHGN